MELLFGAKGYQRNIRNKNIRIADPTFPVWFCRYPTLVLFVEGRGIATARALIESPSSVTNLGLEFRQDVRMYYRVRCYNSHSLLT